MAKYNEKNEEIPDKTPVEVPLGYEKPESLESMIARMVRAHSIQAVKDGLESFEEADDFNIDDEEVPLSTYQMHQMQEEAPVERKSKDKPPVGERRKSPPPAAPESSGDEKTDDEGAPAPVVEKKAPAPPAGKKK